MSQTTVQNSNAIFPFSGYRIQIGDAIGALTDVGACDGDISAAISYTRDKLESANAGTLYNVIKKMLVSLDFTMMEIDPNTIDLIGGGLFNKSTIASAPVVGYSQAVLANASVIEQFLAFEKKQSDATVPTSIVITEDPSGAATVMVLGTDYIVGQDGEGNWGITPLSGSGWTVTEDFTIVYDYTPAASNTLNVGASSVTLSPKIVKFSHVNSAGKERSLTIWSATMGDGGFTFAFGSEVNEGVNTVPITMEGDIDVSRTDGQQLITYLDEQSV